jgi:DNA-binding LacI/PurR family transcriptional regulator
VISLRQLAKLSGLSVCTVSRALRDDERVALETRTRISELAKVHRYKPNHLVSGIFTGRTNVVALVTSDVSEDPTSELIAHLEIELRAAGFASMIFNTKLDPKTEDECLRLAAGHRVAGVIISTVNYEASEAHYRELRRDKVPFVLIDEYSPRVAVPHIHSDDMEQAAALIEHLIQLGHTRIAHIAGPAATNSHSLRLMGYRRAMESARLPISPNYILNTDWSMESGEAAMHQLLNLPQRPSAVFAATDRLAVGAMRAAQSAGLTIPSDLSVAGMGGASFGHFVSPSLTTVSKDRLAIARRAVEVLVSLMNTEPDLPLSKQLMETIIPGQLLIRNSIGPAPAPRG